MNKTGNTLAPYQLLLYILLCQRSAAAIKGRSPPPPSCTYRSKHVNKATGERGAETEAG